MAVTRCRGKRNNDMKNMIIAELFPVLDEGSRHRPLFALPEI